MHNPLPAEHWFKQGRKIAFCHCRMRWMAAPGYKLIRGKTSYRVDGQMIEVDTVGVVKQC